MDVRAQLSMNFNLDKCMGCHTCSVGCKNLWTSRKGAEYMWWNNIETKPGVGYPVVWEDQQRYNGGWELTNGSIQLRQQGGIAGRARTFFDAYAQPNMPTVDDYYEPWTYKWASLYEQEPGNDQPMARPVSLITGEYMDKLRLGPNWDDDLGGSPVYAAADPNLAGLSGEESEQLKNFQRLFHFYLPRICNHCLNPGCVAACPSGALYKRGEDGIVLIDQDRCRGWRYCVSACPYKKTYFNWETGKSEKCIFCYPRLESGQVNACAHTCTGRIRSVGVLLYDAERIEAALAVPDDQLVEAFRDIVLDPHDPEVIAGARANDMEDNWIKAAQESPIYKLVKKWRIAFPLHPEFRTMPTMFYIPPLSPILLAQRGGAAERASAVTGDEDERGLSADAYIPTDTGFFNQLDQMRVPLTFLSNLLSAGNQGLVLEALKKMAAVRLYQRQKRVGDAGQTAVDEALAEVGFSANDVSDIYRLTAVSTWEERFVIPTAHLEKKSALPLEEMYEKRGTVGYGSLRRGLLRREL